MRHLFPIIIFTLIILSANAQENSFTIGGSYVTTNLKEHDENGTGWRIAGLYEYTPMSGNISHGFSFGYIQTKATVDRSLGTETEFKAGNWPIYYAPKYTFGEKSIRFFVKGVLGMHISTYNTNGPLGGGIDTGDAGFYGGLGAGINGNIGESVFINLEYEWAFLGNSWYNNGFINSFTLGVGLRF